MRLAARLFGRVSSMTTRGMCTSKKTSALQNLVFEFREKMSDKSKLKQLMEESLKKTQAMPIMEQQLFIKYLLMVAGKRILPLQYLQEQKAQGRFNAMPHILIEIDMLELGATRDKALKEKLFKEAYARLSLISHELTRTHLNGMLDFAFADFSLRTLQIDNAERSFERAISFFEINLKKTREQLDKVLTAQPKPESSKQERQAYDIRVNGMKEMMKGYIQKMGMGYSDLFAIHYDKNQFEKCEEALHKGLKTFEYFPGVKSYSAIYFQLEKMLMELRIHYKKQDKETLLKDNDALKEKVTATLKTVKSDSLMFTLGNVMIACVRNKAFLQDRSNEVDADISKAVDELTDLIGEEKCKKLAQKMQQADKLLKESQKTAKHKAPKAPKAPPLKKA